MDQEQGKEEAKNFYDQKAKNYIQQYVDEFEEYPTNLIRINFIIERLRKNNVKTILDVGCGTCGPMIKLLKEGFNVMGLDFSKKMVEEGKKELEKAGYDSDLVFFADLENKQNILDKKFDAIIALGVFPHILNEKKALLNMKELLNPNGLVFISFRNDLFSAFSLNKYSLNFFLNKVTDMNSLPHEVQDEVKDFYSQRFNPNAPIQKAGGKVAYNDDVGILAKFHNPLSINKDLFKPCDFSVLDTHFYHFHALPPIFRNKYPKLFRDLSLKLENPNDWKGYLMASAFVIEAKRN